MTGCGSVNVHASDGRLQLYPCRLDAGHHGDCTDATGLHWTRLDEHLRQRGQILDGTHVRKIQP